MRSSWIRAARSRSESCDLDCSTAGEITTHRAAATARRHSVTRAVMLSVTLAVLGLGNTIAFADCEDPGVQRTDLVDERGRAERWNLAWRIGNTAGAAAQFAIAASDVADHDTTRALWISGAATSVGALVAWLVPLDISLPRASDDRCVERAAPTAAAARSADNERRAFWFQHAGSLAVNLGAGIAIAETVSWQAGARSFAIGYAIALLQTYTMPRALWRRDRQPALQVQAIAGRELGVIVGSRF